MNHHKKLGTPSLVGFLLFSFCATTMMSHDVADAFFPTAVYKNNNKMVRRQQKSLHNNCNHMVASPHHQEGGEEEEAQPNLSSLVNGMLQSQRALKQEQNDMQQHSQESNGMPQIGADGIYQIATEQEYKNFLAAHADKLVVLKFSSRSCQACQVLQQKFRQYLHREPTLQQAPVVFANVVVTKQASLSQPLPAFTAFVTQQLHVTRIPIVQFLTSGDGRHVVDQFTCDVQLGCSWSDLRQKLVTFCQTHGNNPNNNNATTMALPVWRRAISQPIRRFFSSASSSSSS